MDSSSRKNPQQFNPVLRWCLLSAGFTSIVVAIVGIFLPVLPTVPFLLLALGCFARSSERLYTWLIDHTHLGPLVRPYLQGGGISRGAKVKAITLIWVGITISVVFFLEIIWVRLTLLAIAFGVTFYLLYLPTQRTDDHE